MQNMPLTFEDLYKRFSDGHIAFAEKTVFFTRQDRNRQAQDSSSEGCTVIDTNQGTQLGVLHIHLELAFGARQN